MKPNEDFIRQAGQIIHGDFDGGTFYVMVADITNFHTVNHFYGAEAGDELLGRLGDILTGWPNMRLCQRPFADLFLGLFFLDDETDIRDVMGGSDVKIQAFLDGWRRRHPACSLKAACGICRVDDDLTEAIDNANTARKTAKKCLSTNTVLYDDAMRKRTAAQYEAESETYRAMQENRFCFYLQPKVNLLSGEIIGAEALARRMGKDGSLIFPDTFLEAMENSGAVMELDRYICRQVCVFLADRIRNGLPVVPISVNLSHLHIRDPAAADKLHAIGEEYHVPPGLVEFELTEAILLEEFSGAKQLIDQLRAYGHKVTIDDFGSAYAGIGVWRELNFDCLKMDRVFLSDSPSMRERNEALMPNIINIAQRLHVQVLCEGVETQEQCLCLLRLGCTAVQGFFFSKPMPPMQLFRMLEDGDGRYPLPDSLAPVKERKTACREPGDGGAGHRRPHPYLLIILSCAVFLGVCITGVLIMNRGQTQQEFRSMVEETLNAYTDGQRESTLLEIAGITSTLDSMAVLFGRDNSPAFISTYLLALNEDSQEVTYSFYSYEDYKEQIADGTARPEASDTLARLMRGETVVSEITFSERMGNVYCIGIGVPVSKDGKFIGAVRGVINAETLVSTELYNPSQGEIAAVFLTDSDSRIFPVRMEEGNADTGRLLDMMRTWGIKEETMDELRAAFASDDKQAKSIRIGIFDGNPYYIAMTGLKYNDWHLVVCLKADRAFAHSQHIVYSTAASIAVLITAVILASAIIILFVRKMQRRFSFEEQRYLLLERFSDTVLFDYDCRRDIIRFTSNSVKLFRVHDLMQKGNGPGQLNLIYVYAGDQIVVRRMLDGQADAPSGEIRVRLMRPDTDEYFWCMIQYQYLYENGVLDSIIGKITDIDEYMRSEERLLRMSETDGLTGLLNKAAAEKQIAERLMEKGRGMLFIIDADGFKHINDMYGHVAGDMALRFIGDCMRRTFREGDVLGRVGGDELTVFVSDINSRRTAQKKAELLQKHLESCLETGVPPLSVSIGVALAPADGNTFLELFSAADKAMYAAKKNGKRQVFFYEDVLYP